MTWLSLLALGAVHGINPAMGWLFAVGRGLQERDRRAVWHAIGPLALGHAAAIAVALFVAITLGKVVPVQWLRWIVAAALLVVGVDGLIRHRHVRLGGMRVNARELATWSFLMASAHGAGLMVLPFTLQTLGAQHHHHAMSVVDPVGLTAALIHTLGYVAVTASLAVIVYEKVGLRILRRAWINLNVLWAGALIAAAVMSVAL
jgi:hypothetical protein